MKSEFCGTDIISLNPKLRELIRYYADNFDLTHLECIELADKTWLLIPKKLRKQNEI